MSDVTIQRGARVPAAPRVSVIIPAYKPDWLEAALASVRAQTFRDFELIVVDDGSPTPVAPADTGDLVLVRHPNAGPGGARNRGVEVARGALLALLDADDAWRPDKLAHQVALHERRPGCVLSTTELAIMGQPDEGPWCDGVVGGSIPFARLFYENCVTTSAAMIRREAWLRTPGMPPRWRLGEDYALWLRLGMLGEIGYLRERLTERRLHDESLSHTSKRDGSWIVQERRIYDDFLAAYPAVRREPFVRAMRARFEFQSGYHHLANGDWGDARTAFAKAILADPKKPRAWVNLARAVLHAGPRR